jgi:hypothetical protein
MQVPVRLVMQGIMILVNIEEHFQAIEIVELLVAIVSEIVVGDLRKKKRGQVIFITLQLLIVIKLT